VRYVRIQFEFNGRLTNSKCKRAGNQDQCSRCVVYTTIFWYS